MLPLSEPQAGRPLRTRYYVLDTVHCSSELRGAIQLPTSHNQQEQETSPLLTATYHSYPAHSVYYRIHLPLPRKKRKKSSENVRNVGAMNAHSSSSVSLALPEPLRRPSVSSRFSYAVSTAERGERGGAPVNGQIEEEIAEIKRYEVRLCVPARGDHSRRPSR